MKIALPTLIAAVAVAGVASTALAKTMEGHSIVPPQEIKWGPAPAVLPPGAEAVGSDLSMPPVMSSEIINPPKNGGLFSIRHGGNGVCTRMVCGFLGCDSVEDNPVITTLPSVLKLGLEEGGAAEWVRSTFQYAAEEVAAGRPRSETVLAKLSELLFVETGRNPTGG